METSHLLGSYYAETDIICIAILALLAWKTYKSSFVSDQKRSLMIVLLIHILFSASDLIWIFNNRFLSLTDVFGEAGVAVSYILNGMNSVLPGATGLAWLCFSESVQGNVIREKKGLFALISLPLVVVFALTVTTGITGFMFTVTPQGEFFRGSGYAVQASVAMGYIIVPSLLAAKRAMTAETIQERKTSMAIVRFIIFPLFACVLQLLVTQMQVMFIGTVIALLSSYISLQELQILTDPLTGLNNRMLLDQKFTAAVQSNIAEKDLYVMVIDADEFKAINDTHGHIVGDRVLQFIAEALRKSCDYSDYLCRYGGDEFVVLHIVPRGEDCAEFVRQVEEELGEGGSPCPVSVSVGTCKYTPERKELNQLINAADEDMYRVKSARKAALNSGLDARSAWG